MAFSFLKIMSRTLWNRKEIIELKAETKECQECITEQGDVDYYCDKHMKEAKKLIFGGGLIISPINTLVLFIGHISYGIYLYT